MQLIKFTYVDSVTKRPVTDEVSKNGPINPEAKGLVFGFELSSLYPTERPVFYGSCDDVGAANVPGVLAVIDKATYEKALASELAARVSKARNAKYDELKQQRKLCEQRGVTFEGKLGYLDLPGPISIPAEKDDQDRVNVVLTNMERFKNELTAVEFKAGDNVFLTLNYEQMRLIGYQMVVHVQKSFTNEGTHSKKISGLKTVEEIQAYDVTTGWPS